jgi:hypothetical protein
MRRPVTPFCEMLLSALQAGAADAAIDAAGFGV